MWLSSNYHHSELTRLCGWNFSTRGKEGVHCSKRFKYGAEKDGQLVPYIIVYLADRAESKYEVFHAIFDVSDADVLVPEIMGRMTWWTWLNMLYSWGYAWICARYGVTGPPCIGTKITGAEIRRPSQYFSLRFLIPAYKLMEGDVTRWPLSQSNHDIYWKKKSGTATNFVAMLFLPLSTRRFL